MREDSEYRNREERENRKVSKGYKRPLGLVICWRMDREGGGRLEASYCPLVNSQAIEVMHYSTSSIQYLGEVNDTVWGVMDLEFGV